MLDKALTNVVALIMAIKAIGEFVIGITKDKLKEKKKKK